ncbi:MAG TPA: SDR family oxidoreductase [Chromatiales bacterium]|nr:SDR family oxidoreductase [Chromatiales bacterium]HIO14493.1 SDR family oxidoreductase [Chromatiales bacterium]
MKPRNDRFILITGCSSGIGLHCAKGLKNLGYRVIATARRETSLTQLRSLGMDVFQLDLRSSESISGACEQIFDFTGNRLYALFNNGAYGQPGAVEDLTREVLRAQFETNLFGTHELTCKVIRHFRQQGEGRIIQNSSILGLVALRYRGAYNASKYALEGLSDTLRYELADSGIHVSLIEPGPIDSEFRANALRAFEANIDMDNSVHRERYQRTVERLNKPGPVAPGTLGPEAVLKKLVCALEDRRPKARYHVTYPTTLLATLKRVLPDTLMDRVLRKL